MHIYIYTNTVRCTVINCALCLLGFNFSYLTFSFVILTASYHLEVHVVVVVGDDVGVNERYWD